MWSLRLVSIRYYIFDNQALSSWNLKTNCSKTSTLKILKGQQQDQDYLVSVIFEDKTVHIFRILNLLDNLEPTNPTGIYFI